MENPLPVPPVVPADPLPVATPPSSQTPPISASGLGWSERIIQFTKGKETILFIAGGEAIIGYLTILYNAYRNNLGFIPPLQAQCILAGLVPSIAIAILIFVVQIWRFYEQKVLEWAAASADKFFLTAD